ncbi:oxidoreductase [Mycobacterium sp. CBMA293]|uniref:PDR/VanB family oxidoreductase n=1 Tax=unclassified Mycolicibacterium TaxID=2636767 RepID=UPI0012DEF97B|nr:MULTISPECIES: PDR/VanB family oxidoreductase [unclassified Mycolicibacterium]MUL49849.1 oxidoreductase [Mycolicibacterium sp. CBMA 360]MUL61517.1 oxidoreductase [Mycolicibacterium sp. CBMA 335]MUL74252.1 oxidoreductase [Mycolicibacterium sp. CBMA 311]MUL97122.1 oxidoreductase [Mycolicibacterium sp. CBMA 230]MUM08182.1 oxidoreductase [Mycolicibacterium sp. CBMA 213]
MSVVHEFTTDLVVHRRETAADGVVALDLVDPAGGKLPTWEPGAHIDLLLDEGLVRQYSLCGDPSEAGTWRVGVLLDPNSRGGSEHVHKHLREGAPIRVRGPRNNFPLIDAPKYLFIAGGIGVTPMKAMAESAERAGLDWTMLYLGRSRSTMAFQQELADTYGDRVTIWSDEERGGFFDLAAALAEPADDTLIYSCGPEPLLAAVEKHSAHWPEGSLHVERFAATAPSAETLAEALDTYQVVCQRSGVTVEVSDGVPMLDALEDAGIPIMSSCGEGVCGTCRSTVLEGTPDHRDSMLTDAERAAGNVILPCVSHSRTEKLVLDL